MVDRPRISVIVPTLRRPDTLLEALASLQMQRGASWEAIVVDDDAACEGLEAALALDDERIRAYRNPGTGQVDARNAGIRAARGDILMWLDDDDLLADRRHMARVASALDTGPALVWRHGWVEPGPGERVPWSLRATPETLRRDNTLLTCGLAYPAALHERLGRLDGSLGGYFDWDWYLRVTHAGVPLLRVPGRGGIYRWHDGPETSQAPGNASARLDAERRARFDRLCAKHGLVTTMKNHRTVFEEQVGRLAPATRTPVGT